MTQTDTSPGVDLPWGRDTTDADRPEDDAPRASVPDGAATADELVRPDMIESTTAVEVRRPTKLMADLSRAMQTAAEGARDETMARFLADSKAVIDEIQAASTEEAAGLRRGADDDVATVREWSKVEIARIREETEARIAARKSALDGEIDAHAAVVETRVQRVSATVEAFQTEMGEFFERLLAEQDPTRIATMAETMPDPPDLAGVAAAILSPAVEPFDPLRARLATVAPDVSPVPEPPASEDTPGLTADQSAEAEAALAARLDFAAAEAEALAFTGDLDDEEPTTASQIESNDPGASAPIIPELAHADEGTLPPMVDAAGRTTTRVIVTGLVSVASIATFKRGLGRAPGIATVGVSSGPDGEFVFTVEHDAAIRVGHTVTTLHGFEARVTAESEGTVTVTAHDPDTAG